jgi:hypothetical protein
MPPAYTDLDNAAAQTTAQVATSERTSPALGVQPVPSGAQQLASPPPSSQPDVVNPTPSRLPPATAISNPGLVSEDGRRVTPSSQLSTKAAGKKRQRDDDEDDDDDDDAEALAGPSGSGSGSQSTHGDDEPGRKRVRVDTQISLERLPISEELLEYARSYSCPELTRKERQHQYEKLSAMKRLFRRRGGP